MFRFETISILIPGVLQECLIQGINHSTSIRLTARFPARHVTRQLRAGWRRTPSVRVNMADGTETRTMSSQSAAVYDIPCPTNELVSHLSRDQTCSHLIGQLSTNQDARRNFGNFSATGREYTTHPTCPQKLISHTNDLPSVWLNILKSLPRIDHAWIQHRRHPFNPQQEGQQG